MCGRFESKIKTDDLEKIFKEKRGRLHIDYDLAEVLKEENIAPTDRIRVIVVENGEFKIKVMKWAIRTKVYDPSKAQGLFGDEQYIEKDVFNSRIETVKGSPDWRSLILKYRCIVPMTAFYEWTKSTGPKKEPQRISIYEEKLFFAGGIYKQLDIRNQAGASILTCEPNRFMKPIHNRMPILFKPEIAADYLTIPKEGVFDLCEPLDDIIKMEMEKAEI